MIWPLLRAGIYWTIGGVQALGEGAKLVGKAAAALHEFVTNARRGTLPMDEEEPFPLAHKDSERIAEFGRRAGHEDDYKNAVPVNDSLSQPIPKAPRVPKI